MKQTGSFGRIFLGIARMGLGAFFIYMGLSKALHPEGFLKLVRAYDIVPVPLLLNTIAAALPWFEAVCGLFLLLGVAVRGTAFVVASMLVPFTVLVAWRAAELAAEGAIAFCAVKFDCGCGAGEVFICGKIGENLSLLILAVLLFSGRGRWAALRHDLLPARSSAPTAERQEISA